MTDDDNPVFDPDGQYLYFVSGRNYNALLGGEDFTFVNRHMQEIVAVPLAADTPSPTIIPAIAAIGGFRQ